MELKTREFRVHQFQDAPWVLYLLDELGNVAKVIWEEQEVKKVIAAVHRHPKGWVDVEVIENL
jgi:hypothetical protein